MPIDVEAIAKRHAVRPGCRFIGFKAVGISVFVLKVRALVIEPRELPPIEEFLLRFLAEGIETPRLLCDLMGIEYRLVESRLVELRRQELIDVNGSANTPRDLIRCQLTDKGREAAQMLRQTVMQDITVPNVVFHGLLRKPVQIGEIAKRTYLRPKEAKDQGLTLIRAIPNRAPHAEEIDVNKLDRVVKAAGRPRPGEPVRDVVAVKNVLRPVQSRYESGVMLEYETTDREHTRQVAFAIDGQLLDEYEAAFFDARGPEQLSEILSPHEDTFAARAEREIPAHIRQQLGSLDDIESLATSANVARQEVEDAAQRLERSERADTRTVLREELERVRERARRAEEERDQRKAKYLWTPEIRDKYWEALRTCEDRLLILSGFINSDVVNGAFEDALRGALQRGVRVWIGYGFDKDRRRGQQQREDPKWVEAEKCLRKLKNEFPDLLDFRDIGRSHEKRLICDTKFTFGGSFNFLSFSGEQRGPGKLRHEGADLIESPEYCEDLYERYSRLFFN